MGGWVGRCSLRLDVVFLREGHGRSIEVVLESLQEERLHSILPEGEVASSEHANGNGAHLPAQLERGREETGQERKLRVPVDSIVLGIVVVEGGAQLLFVFEEESARVENLLEQVCACVVLVGHLVHLAVEAVAHLFGAVVVVDFLEGNIFVNIGQHFALIIGHVLEVHLGDALGRLDTVVIFLDERCSGQVLFHFKLNN